MKQKMVFLLLLTVPVVLIAGEPSKRLSVEQAELLARTAAESSGVTRLKGFSLEKASLKQFPDFYFFDAIVAEAGAEGFSGHYAVNKITGEVWDPYKCARFSDPHLSKLQNKMRKELGLSGEDYRQHRNDNPCLGGGK